ncbi:MAG: flagellar protein FlaG [Proteobacteria bacterium]|nr:flagellar protein FlaG [Pseudomonadota bacterium]
MINSITAASMQTTETKSATVMPFRSPLPQEENNKQALNKTSKAIEEQRQTEELRKAQEKTPLEQKAEKDKEINQKMLDDLSNDFEILHSVGLSFAKHEDTGRTFVKVINKDTKELIREIPAEQVLNMAAKLDEMIGILFDAKV